MTTDGSAATSYITDVQVERGPPAGAARFTTYNFEVADWSTYFVSPPDEADEDNPIGLWVHNTGRGACERIASIYHRIRDRDGLSPFDSFTVFMEKTNQPARRAVVDSHLRYAAREMSLDMMSDPAHVLSHAQMKNAIANNPAMQGRVGLATKLEVHHSVPIYVQGRIIGFPTDRLNDCPGLLLHVVDHKIGNIKRPNSFHTILNKYIPEHPSRFNDKFPNGLSRDRAKTELTNAYRDWLIQNGLEDPGIDHLANFSARISAWMDSVP
ncbi:MAG: hypothetical protein EA376_03635 [Phycisphaeraceae bacterium]|nr:MAG: hypothetical protein EA376_03635 [Phycisphaeraceae bacterium]